MEKETMIKYTSNEKFTIWADISTWKYFIQMNGGEIEDKGYNIAAEAMEEAYNR